MDKEFLKEYDMVKRNYLELEKKIWELANYYKENPNEIIGKTIVDLCSIAKGQIMILRTLLPKIGDKKAQANYESIFNEKEDDLFEIANGVIRNKQK